MWRLGVTPPLGESVACQRGPTAATLLPRECSDVGIGDSETRRSESGEMVRLEGIEPPALRSGALQLPSPPVPFRPLWSPPVFISRHPSSPLVPPGPLLSPGVREQSVSDTLRHWYPSGAIAAWFGTHVLIPLSAAVRSDLPVRGTPGAMQRVILQLRGAVPPGYRCTSVGGALSSRVDAVRKHARS
jgi:hypothetical protein